MRINFPSICAGAAACFWLCANTAPAQSPSPSMSPAASPSAAATSTPNPHPGPVFDWKGPNTHPDRWAEFRLWIPAGLNVVQGVVTLAPGSNGDGRGMVDDPQFRALAERTQTALMGYFMKGQNYERARIWSGSMFVRALRELGELSHHKELDGAPLAMWGHSAGGMFNYNFACWKPERVAVFIVNKGAYYDVSPEGGVLGVPAIWFAGQKDEDYRLQGITDYFVAGRRQGAPWALALEPNAGHELGRTKAMGIAFIETMLRQRLVEVPGKTATLRPLGPQPWTGGLTHHEIAPFNPQTDTRINAWLPDEITAQRWQAFVTGAPFADL